SFRGCRRALKPAVAENVKAVTDTNFTKGKQKYGIKEKESG
ncbi:26_t:CDS:1, partial [Entrophospora sp. SA101]